ncbi:ABC transporter ATP-binding protein [Pseudothermotoga thermarum]|uniref:Nucleoside ABC transporter ATP-binding protein n=1 Tax=Pseudothermotoga thermarum DSM 5069 TaxID=688269 RepID=F7YTR6_9THEM|nr:ABC transporter ATP-binding protein [Pseudothermotoga thermarum]AEH51296.1 nucleoside ABC transporter ATP-binding protein [Pseudothermotoga thermarum DSM 5069]
MEKAVEMINIVKKFPGVVANDDVNLTVFKGEIHAIVGENGAGKTTLMNQLYGLLQPDSGEIRIFGQPVKFKGPRDAIAKGIGMVHQHFMLVNNLTVAENVVLGAETTKGFIFDLKTARKKVEELSKSYGLLVDPIAKIEDLPVGMQQRVEIIKTLYRGAEILILDEPTAVLTPQETKELFGILRKLKESGKTIIFISHKLEEVMEISDRITVMRQGKVVGVLNKHETNPKEIARLMVGRDVVFTVEKLPANPKEVVLRVEDLWVKDYRHLDAVKGVSFEVRAGEIYGIAGVAGNGQTELVEALTGLRKIEKGKVIFLGQDVTNKSVRELRQLGLAHIPEDRHKYGLVLQFPAYYNVILGRHNRQPFAKSGFLVHREIYSFAEKLLEEFDVRPRNIKMLGGNFSGGNQQKLVVAREMSAMPKLIVVSQPTRGLDVGATEFIHRILIKLRDSGVAILLVSMELDEILSLSDRLAVMYRGEFMGEVDPKKVSIGEIGLMMTGHRVETVGGTEK